MIHTPQLRVSFIPGARTPNTRKNPTLSSNSSESSQPYGLGALLKKKVRGAALH